MSQPACRYCGRPVTLVPTPWSVRRCWWIHTFGRDRFRLHPAVPARPRA